MAHDKTSLINNKQTLLLPTQNNNLENQQKQSLIITPNNQKLYSLKELNTFNKKTKLINNIESGDFFFFIITKKNFIFRLFIKSPNNCNGIK